MLKLKRKLGPTWAAVVGLVLLLLVNLHLHPRVRSRDPKRNSRDWSSEFELDLSMLDEKDSLDILI
ncbi:hypothetical protein P154DRAFT_525930 [Amniculicola lignicola CBS 123094]|uniref:Uncharacterized protein n=1 Tax=Amniculicola lignicola CBS 123094 TaxID=1392246 RepID=A0A6A5W564_9PLEO|nr:hypothetical protein P154DRAFT_525930 [Amniculicola lignicola CBS 123094]